MHEQSIHFNQEARTQIKCEPKICKMNMINIYVRMDYSQKNSPLLSTSESPNSKLHT